MKALTKLFFILQLAVFTVGCVGDAAVSIKGELLNTNSEPYKDCSLMTVENESSSYQKKIPGKFKTTIIFSPSAFNDLVIEFSCKGTLEVYRHTITSIPKPFGTVLDVGSVILN